MRSSSFVYAALLGAGSLTSMAHAQAEGAALEPIHLGELVLSGGLSPIAAARYGQSYSVITAQEMQERGLTSVQDALRALPGISISGLGRGFTQVRMRGLEANHTLILIDGIDAGAGGEEYMFSGFDATQIERIEVLRGPQTVYYGSSASAGVINIITKKAEKSGYGAQAAFGNGHIWGGYVQQRSDRAGLRLDYTDQKDRGVDDSASHGERDAIHRKTLRLTGDWQANEQLSLRTIFSKATENYAYDDNGYSPDAGFDVSLDNPDALRWIEEEVAGISGAYEMADGWLIHDLSVTRSLSKSRFDQATPWSTAGTDALKYKALIGLDGAVTEASHQLNLLVERQQDKAFSPASDWQPRDIHYRRDTTSYAAEYRAAPSDAMNYQAGVRYDDNEQFKDFISWNLAGSYQLNPSYRLHGSLGRASVAPTFVELYAIFENWQGNQYLSPEESQGGDIGLEFTTADGRGVFDVTLFKQSTTNRIVPEYVEGKNRPRNDAGKTRARGLEFGGNWEVNDQWGVGASYTWMQSHRADGSQAVRRPKHEASLRATWRDQAAALTLTGELRLVSGNWDQKYIRWAEQPASKMPGYGVVNVSGNYTINDTLAVTAKILNVFDKEYSETWGYAAQDRAIWLGLNANF